MVKPGDDSIGSEGHGSGRVTRGPFLFTRFFFSLLDVRNVESEDVVWSAGVCGTIVSPPLGSGTEHNACCCCCCCCGVTADDNVDDTVDDDFDDDVDDDVDSFREDEAS